MFVQCEDCKHRFDISPDGMVVHKREFKDNGKSIFLTYYDCPNCARRHYVQIDDQISLAKMKRVNATFVKLSIAKRKGKTISEKQQAKFKKARENLSNYRIYLMKSYTGKSFYDDETDSNFVLRFSV